MGGNSQGFLLARRWDTRAGQAGQQTSQAASALIRVLAGRCVNLPALDDARTNLVGPAPPVAVSGHAVDGHVDHSLQIGATGPI